MLRRLAFTLTFALLATQARAACEGQDLVPTLPASERAAIAAAVDATPFARGNAWRAIRGSQVVDIVGTYHFDDPRHETVMATLGPTLDVASVLLVEAGPRETGQLAADMTSRPELLYIMQGPTLPELLPDADWRLFSDAMSARGIPAIFAAKMQPWYATMVLSTPPCMMANLAEGETRGLDRRIIERAEERRIPIRALEPYDTAFRLFQNLPRDLQVDMIRMSLATDELQAEDMMATLTKAYFDEDVRLTWELGRIAAKKLPGMTAEKVDSTYAAMEEALMTRRNESWLPVIEDAARRGRVFAAFGALHLSGERGILKLLERAGFRIERQSFQ